MAPAPKRIRVLIVDDSVFFRTVLTNVFVRSQQIQVVGSAADAFEARDKIRELKPDVVTLDINMPKMNGIDFLKELIPKNWMPVVVITTQSDIVFEAMNAGAVDFVEKPAMTPGHNLDAFADDIINKIVIASSATPANHNRRVAAVKRYTTAGPRLMLRPEGGLIALGASTGGTEATSFIMKQLPADLPGMVIVQHMPPVFTSMYAQRLDRETKYTVKEAEDKDRIRRGHAYVAPGDKHIIVVKEGTDMYIRTNVGEKVNGHRPSVDVMFDSVAKFADKTTTGIILTGMGADGAKGIVKMRKRGAFTIGQDEQSSVVYGMPMVAQKLGGIVKQASLDTIAKVLVDHLAGKL